MKNFLSLLGVIILTVPLFYLNAATITSTATGGSWTAGGTWIGGVAPLATDDVIIATTGGNSVSTTTFAGTVTAVNITVNNQAILNSSALFGTLNCSTLTINSGGTVNMSSFCNVTSATSVSGSIRISAGVYSFGQFTLSSGSSYVEAGSPFITFTNSFSNNATTFTSTSNTSTHTFTGSGMTISGATTTTYENVAINGTYTNDGTITVGTALSGSGTLTNGASASLNLGGTATVTNLTATAAGNTVNYYGAAQTAKVTTYNNLTVSGSGVKTFVTSPTVNGILSLEGTATITVTTGVVTYGANATLQYNTATSRTASSEEWITPFAATGGIIIANTGTITMDAVKIMDVSIPLTINNGATLATNNFQLTFWGDLVNNGTFTAGTGTVVLGRGGAQSVSGSSTTSFYNLTVSTSGLKTFTTIPIVNGVLSMQGAATVSASPSYGASATLEYNTSTNRTAGVEWITPFAASGGVKIASTGIITMNTAKDFGDAITLTINIGSSLSTNNYALNLGGDLINDGTFTVGNSAVNLNRGGAQAISGSSVTTFNNLTLSVSGLKTFTTLPVINGILSMEGSATVSAAPTYGAGATLQYNTSTSRTAGAEWISPFAGSGGVIIANTGTITMDGAKVFNASIPLTVNNGASLATNNFSITFGGDFLNSGSFTAGSSAIDLAYTAATQNIAGFTTTGLVSMTKTSGTATFTGSVSAGGLTINGPGGTLNLGNLLTHTFSGTWTMTDGTLDGGSSIVNFTAATVNSGSGGTFSPNTGTVNFSRAGAQTVPPLSYNNLTVSGSGVKTFATDPTVNGTLSMEGTATITVTGGGTGRVVYGPSATLQYNTASPRTVSNEEWLPTYSYNGGVIIANTGTITLNGDKLFANNTPLTINNGASLATGTRLLTLRGNFVNNGSFTAGSSAVVLGRGGAQSLSGTSVTTFNNLTINNSGLKTFATIPIVNGILSMEGTGVATVSAPPTYGTNATLQYKVTSARISGIEWITPFAASGGVRIDSTGIITINEPKVFNASVPLTINLGSTLATGNNSLTFGGDFLNSGTLTAGSSPIVIANTAATQSISGFTTTGLVSMTKTSGIATFSGGVSAGGLTINGAGGTLNLGSGLTHAFSGTWTRTNGTLNGGSSTLSFTGGPTVVSGTGGTFTAGTGTINYARTGDQTVAVLPYNNLALSGSGTKTLATGSTITIAGTTNIDASAIFSIPPGTSVTTTGVVTNSAGVTGLVIGSDASSTGSLIINNTGVNGSIQRYMTKGKWHIISIPADGQDIGDYLVNPSSNIGYNSTTFEYGMAPYDPAANLWASYFTAATPGTLNAGEGYIVRRKNSGIDGVVVGAGTIISGNKTLTGLVSGKWNCIGNPYTSTIGAKSTAGTVANFLDANASNLEPTHAAMYLWNEQADYTGPTRSDYMVISNSGYIPVLSKDYLQVGQGFLVKMAAGATSIDFTPDMQSHQVTESYIKKSSTSWPGFELVASTPDLSISTIVAFNEKMTTGLDPTYDAGVLKGNPNMALYTRLVSDNGTDFAIQCLPLDGLDTFIIAVGIDFLSGGDISFSARTDHFPYGSHVILEDRLTGVFTDLGENNAVYTVNLPPSGFGTGRFYLHTGDGQANNIPEINHTLQVYSSGKKIYIMGELSSGNLISLYSTQGVLIRTYSPANSINRQLDAEGISDGIYILKILDNKESNSYKLFLGN